MVGFVCFVFCLLSYDVYFFIIILWRRLVGIVFFIELLDVFVVIVVCY